MSNIIIPKKRLPTIPAQKGYFPSTHKKNDKIVDATLPVSQMFGKETLEHITKCIVHNRLTGRDAETAHLDDLG